MRARGSSAPPPAGTRHTVPVFPLATKRAPLLGSNATPPGLLKPVAQLQLTAPDGRHMHAITGTSHTHPHNHKHKHIQTQTLRHLHTFNQTNAKRTHTNKKYAHTRSCCKNTHIKEVNTHHQLSNIHTSYLPKIHQPTRSNRRADTHTYKNKSTHIETHTPENTHLNTHTHKPTRNHKEADKQKCTFELFLNTNPTHKHTLIRSSHIPCLPVALLPPPLSPVMRARAGRPHLRRRAPDTPSRCSS
jgi:hypothetical protein